MRPRCAVGHVGPLRVHSIPDSVAFYRDLGMRTVLVRDSMAILELRGGTHLIMQRGAPQPGRVPFDLMVDDLDTVRQELLDRGVTLGPTRAGGVHRTFVLHDPDGHTLSITSSHVTGPV